MAKLNGVTVVAEKVTYNGAEYVKTDATAKVGDIIRLGDDFRSYLTDGGYYEVESVDSSDDAQITDDDGDNFDTACLSEGFTVFTKVTAAATSADDSLTVDGVQYRKVARKAVKGDKYVVANVDEADLRKGAIYAIRSVDRDGDVTVRDDANDIHALNNDEFSVLEPVTSAQPTPTPSPSVTTLPSVLPAEYIVHEGAVYRKESRKAEKGELVEVTGHPNCDANGVFTVRTSDYNGHIYYDSYGRLPGGYAVLLPTDTVTLNGTEYTLEKRPAKIGDKVVVVTFDNSGHLSTNPAKNGNIYDVTQVDHDGDVSIDDDHLVYLREYSVLKQLASAPKYTEVKRKANVGEQIRIVEATLTDGNYTNGDEYTVTYVNRVGGVRFNTGANESYAYRSEYVVLEPITVAVPDTAAKETKPERLAVGDYAKVANPSALRSYRKDAIVKIIKDAHDSQPFEAEVVGTSESNWYFEAELVRATDAEISAAQRKSVKVGDYVKITVDECGDHVNTIVKVKRINRDGSVSYDSVRSPGAVYGASAEAYEPVTAAEAETARKQAEEAKAKAAEERKWAAIGRKVGEFKAGDVVRVTGTCAGHSVGTIGTVVYDEMSLSKLRVEANGIVKSHLGQMELIAPVESLFTVK